MEDYEISVQELSKRDADSYILIDIRDDSSYSYGNIPGSLHVPKDILEADYEKYKDKPLILYCKKGETSAETVQFLKEKNIEAKSLKGGYLAWLMESMKQEEEQQDAFVEEADVQTEPATTAQGTGTYEVAFINEGQFNTCLRTDEDRPDVEMQTMEKTTLTNALNSMEGDNTGYCLVVPHDLEDEEDIVVPEGMNVFVGYGDGDVKIRSITPNGNITFWGVGNDKESIEIKEGKGTVTFKQLHMNGEIKGTGADDTVTFVDDAMIGGISGIENVHRIDDHRGVGRVLSVRIAVLLDRVDRVA